MQQSKSNFKIIFFFHAFDPQWENLVGKMVSTVVTSRGKKGCYGFSEILTFFKRKTLRVKERDSKESILPSQLPSKNALSKAELRWFH